MTADLFTVSSTVASTKVEALAEVEALANAVVNIFPLSQRRGFCYTFHVLGNRHKT